MPSFKFQFKIVRITQHSGTSVSVIEHLGIRRAEPLHEVSGIGCYKRQMQMVGHNIIRNQHAAGIDGRLRHTVEQSYVIGMPSAQNLLMRGKT